MNAGDLLVAGAGLSGVALLFSLSGKGGLPGRPSLYLALSTALLASALLLLTAAFLRDDFTLQSVWRFSSLDLPVHYKVAALYTSQEGSYLLWGFLTFLWAWIFARKGRGDPLARRSVAVAVVVGLALVAVTLRLSPFAPADPGTPAADGLSLNPLLRTPWVNIHPPMIFIAFSCLTVLFAGALAGLAGSGGDDRAWERRTRTYARLAWLLLGFANALGAFWSYEVLGWGGFWAWDPVETSLLLPWLVLTAHLHAAARLRSRGEFPVAAPALGALVFVLVLYEAFVTRSGFFNSVHAFAASPSGPYLLAMVAGSGAATLFLAVKRWHSRPAPAAEPPPAGASFWTGDATLFLGVILGFLATAAIAGGFLTHPPLLQAATGLKVAYTREKFDAWLGPLFLGAVLLMGFYLDRRRSLPLLGAFAAATFGASFLSAPGLTLLPPDNPFYLSLPPVERFLADRSKAALLPPLAYLALGALPRLRSLGLDRASGRRLALGALHAGLLLVVIGYAASSTASFSTGELADLAPGGPPGPGNLRVSAVVGEAVGDLLSSERVQDVVLTEVAAGRGRVVVGSPEPPPGPRLRAEGPLGTFSPSTGRPLTVIFAREALPATGTASRLVQRAAVELDGSPLGVAEFEEDALWGATTRPLIRRGLLSDTYIVFQGLQPDGRAPLTVKEVPLSILVWIGVALLVAGGAGLLWVAKPRKSETMVRVTAPASPGRRPPPGPPDP
ncbi:MAG: cytochrome c biogenesis protein CcsA [Halobacteria archaeon]